LHNCIITELGILPLMTKLANLCMQCPDLDWGIKLAKLASGIKLAIPVSRSVLGCRPDEIEFWPYMLLPPIIYMYGTQALVGK
jgi:hypothetical protein